MVFLLLALSSLFGPSFSLRNNTYYLLYTSPRAVASTALTDPFSVLAFPPSLCSSSLLLTDIWAEKN